MPNRRQPWPPPKPKNFEFTPHIKGWAKWYKGQTRTIALKTLDRQAVRDAWDDQKKKIDAALAGQARLAGGKGTLREVASEFYAYLDHRVTTGHPAPMSEYTREDYKRYVGDFGRTAGADRPLADYRQDDFTAFAKTLAGRAPSTLARAVANVQGFFQWAVDEGHLDELPPFGRYFVKPKMQESRDVRLAQEKSYATGEVPALWRAATHVERCWIALGLNGALDNADLANLPLPEVGGVLDLDAALLDYRRRKRGKVRRVIPLRPLTVRLIRHYLKRHRAAPALPEYAGLLFLTESGLPLGRIKESEARPGRANPIDAVAGKWQRLMVRAGLRAKPTVTTTGRGASRKRSLKFAGDADRRGFRSLRTSFVNLAPPGYRDEVEIILGHSHGSVLLDNYLERFGLDRLRGLVDHIWDAAFTSPPPPGAVPGPPPAAPPGAGGP